MSKMTKQEIIILNRLFADAKRMATKLETVNGDPYYKLQEELKVVLNQIRDMDFLELSKPRLIEFLCWCSHHRPLEPWKLLVDISVRFKARQEFNQTLELNG